MFFCEFFEAFKGTYYFYWTRPGDCSWKVFRKKVVLRHWKTPVSKASFCNKVASSEPLTLLKKRLRHEYFLGNFKKLVI